MARGRSTSQVRYAGPAPSMHAARTVPEGRHGMPPGSAPVDLVGAYAELRLTAINVVLLSRAVGYYLWRTAGSFALLTVGVASVWLLPGSQWTGVHSALLAFGSVQVALIGHDAGHLAVTRSARANLALGQLCWSLV